MNTLMSKETFPKYYHGTKENIRNKRVNLEMPIRVN